MRLSHRPGPNSTFGFRFLQSRPERRLRCHTASDLELFPVDPLFAGVADEYDSWSVGPVVPPLQPPRSSPVQALDGGSALTVALSEDPPLASLLRVDDGRCVAPVALASHIPFARSQDTEAQAPTRRCGEGVPETTRDFGRR